MEPGMPKSSTVSLKISFTHMPTHHHLVAHCSLTYYFANAILSPSHSLSQWPITQAHISICPHHFLTHPLTHTVTHHYFPTLTQITTCTALHLTHPHHHCLPSHSPTPFFNLTPYTRPLASLYHSPPHRHHEEAVPKSMTVTQIPPTFSTLLVPLTYTSAQLPRSHSLTQHGTHSPHMRVDRMRERTHEKNSHTCENSMTGEHLRSYSLPPLHSLNSTYQATHQHTCTSSLAIATDKEKL